MRIIVPIFITFLLLSCGNSDEKSGKQRKMDEIQSEISILEKELSIIDAQIEQINQLKYEVNNIKLLTFHWVENQSRSDSKEKLELVESEKKSRDIIVKIKKTNESADLKSQIKSVDNQLEEVLLYVNDVKITLSSFESYEDISNLFLTKVLIEPGGDLDLTIENLLLNIEGLQNLFQKEKMKVQLKIKDKRLSLKKLSAH